MGRNVSLEEIKEIMAKHDKSNDGKIQYEEFKQMLFEDTEERDDSALTRSNIPVKARH